MLHRSNFSECDVPTLGSCFVKHLEQQDSFSLPVCKSSFCSPGTNTHEFHQMARFMDSLILDSFSPYTSLANIRTIRGKKQNTFAKTEASQPPKGSPLRAFHHGCVQQSTQSVQTGELQNFTLLASQFFQGRK